MLLVPKTICIAFVLLPYSSHVKRANHSHRQQYVNTPASLISKTNRTARRQQELCDTMAMCKIKLVGALSVLTVASGMGLSSCVQLNATDLSSCPCDDAILTFTLEGETSVQANTVSECV